MVKLKAKNKTVSNASLAISAILNLLEVDDFSVSAFNGASGKIVNFFYELDRHIQRKINNEFYVLDFSSRDLKAVAELSQKWLHIYEKKCTYSSMKKELISMMPLHAGDFSKWQRDRCDFFAVVTSLRRMVSVFSYQAILVELLENDDDANKIENVMLDAIKDAMRHRPQIS